ncbi:transporter substrate-binding domain-containing protein [Terasakiella sp. SH-1]|uniref:substrate-binding periplasmic protein n=1 Tax=Terasakiella sp. SH-1 TaxID=2560057 RepID=UPI00107397F0|nr:transporter substrate-binding domain-containing protein [Terasakiella sp. SH-1]
MPRYILFLSILLWGALPAGAETFTFSAREKSLMDKIGAEILKVAYSRLGHDIQVRERPGTRALTESNSGHNDGVVMRLEKVMAKNRNLVKVNVPLWEFQVAVFAVKPIHNIQDWQDINARSVATYRGYKYVESKLTGPHRDLVSSFDIGMKMLAKGRFDLLVYGRLDGLESASRVKPTQLFCQSNIASFDEFHMVHHRHQYLVHDLEKQLAAMQQSGELAQIQKRVLNENIGAYSGLCE